MNYFVFCASVHTPSVFMCACLLMVYHVMNRRISLMEILVFNVQGPLRVLVFFHCTYLGKSEFLTIVAMLQSFVSLSFHFLLQL